MIRSANECLASAHSFAAPAVVPLRPLAQTATAFAELPFTKVPNVVYGKVGDKELLLDVYQPPLREQPRPAVILLHPGAWTAGFADRNFAPIQKAAERLAGAGYVAFNADYRLTEIPSGGFAWPSQLDDVQRLVRWVRHNALTCNVDPDRIGAYGHSAGAQLASMLGLQETRDDSVPELAGISSRVSCVVALAGHFDLTIPYPQQVDRESLIRLLGGTAAEFPDRYQDASPLTWVDNQSAPFLIIHGVDDDKNPLDHPRKMVDALHAAAIAVTSEEATGHDHFSVAEWDEIAGSRTLPFFAAHLHPEV